MSSCTTRPADALRILGLTAVDELDGRGRHLSRATGRSADDPGTVDGPATTRMCSRQFGPTWSQVASVAGDGFDDLQGDLGEVRKFVEATGGIGHPHVEGGEHRRRDGAAQDGGTHTCRGILAGAAPTE